jgi:outer membrane protein assembly factor BamB
MLRKSLAPGLIALFFVTAITFTLQAAAPEWPEFLGPSRNGISSDTGLIDQWPKDGLPVVWRVKGGVGMSGIAISQGKAITLLHRNGNQQLVALSAERGEPLWATPLAPEYENQMGDGPRATPTISGDRVYAFTGEGMLAACSLADGKLLWSLDVPGELKVEPAEYGMACSPLVVGENVVVAGGTKGTVVAVDAKSGKIAWKAGEDPAGYSSPALLQVGGEKQLVAFTGASAIGVSPQDGKLLWRHPYVTPFHCNTATPVAFDNQVFLSSGENHGSVMLELKRSGGRYEPSETWSSQGARSVLRSEWQTPIVLGDHIYGFDNVGSAGPVTHLACIHAPTGKRAWQQTRFGKGNMIAADGKLWISTFEGELMLAKATPEGFEELGRMEVTGRNRQAPALANGLLYLRDDAEIVCLDARKR